MEEPRILIVEGEPEVRERRARALLAKGYEVETANGLDQALECFRRDRFPVVVTNSQTAGSDDGLEVARQIRAIRPDTKVIIITTTDRQKDDVDDIQVNVAYVEKGEQAAGPMLDEAIDRAFNELRELKVRRYMLSFLTHTMRNTFAGAAPALDEALSQSRALAPRFEEDQDVFETILNLAFLRTSFATVDSMLDVYKLLGREPENLRRAWAADQGGSSRLDHVLEAALSAVLSRLFFQDALIPTFNRLATCHQIDDPDILERQFLSEFVLAPEESRPTVAKWLESVDFGFIRIEGLSPQLHLDLSGVRFSLLFAVISELSFNAVKYADGSRPIHIEWLDEEGFCRLRINNPCNLESIRTFGAKKGREFIDTLLKPLVGLRVDYREIVEEPRTFEVRLSISKNQWAGGNS